LRLELLAAKIQLFREISAESSQIFISVKSQYVKERNNTSGKQNPNVCRACLSESRQASLCGTPQKTAY